MLRAGIIGAGRIAWRYDGGVWDGRRSVTHAACIDRHPETQLVAVCEPVAAARARFVAEHPQAGRVAVTDDLDGFLDLELDLVAIASPSAEHGAHIRACLDRGVGRLWIEKPVTLALDEYCALRAHLAGMTAPPRTVVNYTRRFLPQYRRARDWMSGCGRVHAIELVYSRGLDVNGVHLLDILGFLTGADQPPALDWLRPGPGKNPDFGLSLGDVRVTVTGHDLPYHAIDLVITAEVGRFSVTRGGRTVTEERAVPNPDYPGFFHLDPPVPVLDAEGWDHWMREGTYLSLCDLVETAAAPVSSLETAFFAQALLDRALPETSP